MSKITSSAATTSRRVSTVRSGAMALATPITFAPIFQPYLWGGRRLADWFSQAPAEGPVAEAWLLSDEEKHASRAAGASHRGATIRELRDAHGAVVLGDDWDHVDRFPLLLKLLDARDHLSVQVHPNDEQAKWCGPNQRGKTEAWVVLEATPGARLFSGLNHGVDPATLRTAVDSGELPQLLHCWEPAVGDVVFLPAGTVHAIGAGLLLFEIQQTSDLTYRLHDWNRIDPRTGRQRELHWEQGMQSIDFHRGPVGATKPIRETPIRELLVDCEHFRLWRHRALHAFEVGSPGECRVVVCVDGSAELESGETVVPMQPGSAWLLPADVSIVHCRPFGSVTLLECGLPCRNR